jgi:DNA-binding response OmpR family regulator
MTENTPLNRRQFVQQMLGGLAAMTILPGLPAVAAPAPLDLHTFTRERPILVLKSLDATQLVFVKWLLHLHGLHSEGRGTTTGVIERLLAGHYSMVISAQRLQPTYGTDVLAEIRSTPAIADTPFMFLSAMTMPNPVVRPDGRELWADGGITMPCVPSDLADLTVRVLHQRYDAGQTALDSLLETHLNWRFTHSSMQAEHEAFFEAEYARLAVEFPMMRR